MPRRHLIRSTTRLQRAAIKLHRFLHANLGSTEDWPIRFTGTGGAHARDPAGCLTNCRTKWNALGTGRDASNSLSRIESGNQLILNNHVGDN